MDAEAEFLELTRKLKTAVDDCKAIPRQIESRFAEIEQKMTRRPGAGAGAFAEKSVGEIITSSDWFKGLNGNFNGQRQRFSMKRSAIEAKAITSAGTSGGALIAPDYQMFNDPVEIWRRSTPVRALFSQTPTASNSIIYPRQATRSLNAAPVAEGALKPQSDATFTDVTVPVRTLAHTFRFSRQLMEDAGAFGAFLNDEARYGLRLLEEAQFLYGDNTGQNLWGIIPQATAFAAPYSIPSPTSMDQIALAIAQLANGGFAADGVIMHPVDFIKIMTIKDGEGRYIAGDPFSEMVIKLLWNVRYTTTLTIPQGSFIVGAFANNVRIFDRMEVEVLLSTEDQDNFVTNQITCRAEERTALTVLRPTAIIAGTFPT